MLKGPEVENKSALSALLSNFFSHQKMPVVESVYDGPDDDDADSTYAACDGDDEGEEDEEEEAEEENLYESFGDDGENIYDCADERQESVESEYCFHLYNNVRIISQKGQRKVSDFSLSG